MPGEYFWISEVFFNNTSAANISSSVRSLQQFTSNVCVHQQDSRSFCHHVFANVERRRAQALHNVVDCDQICQVLVCTMIAICGSPPQIVLRQCCPTLFSILYSRHSIHFFFTYSPNITCSLTIHYDVCRILTYDLFACLDFLSSARAWSKRVWYIETTTKIFSLATT